jgi:plasmid stabilization system protein ParE
VTVVWTDTSLAGLAETPASIGREILRKVRTARRFPTMFPERHRGRYRGYRWFPAGAWLVFYQVAGKRLIVLGIMHGTMRDA